MALSPFTRELGLSQGRVQPSGWVAPEGEYVVVLGSDLPGRRVRLADGDHVRVTQTSDAGGAKLLRARLRTRPPTTAPPSGVSWVGRLTVDGVVVLELPITQARDYADVVANVSALGGAFPVELRLEVGGAALPDELELPALYVDAWLLDTTSARPLLANRVPEPGSVDNDRSTPIAVDVIDTTAAGIALAETRVYVDGVLAFDAGAFQVGFTGIGSTTSSRDGGRTRRVVLDRQASFDGGATVTVRVVSRTTDGAPIDQSYTFLVEDVAAPRVMSATATGESTIRVSFDEQVKQVSAGDTDDALNAENWALAIVDGIPAVWATVTAVASAGGTAVDLTTDLPLTSGSTYRVIASRVVDVFGNEVIAPNNGATFVGLGEQSPGRRFDVIELLPPANEEEDATGDLRRFVAVIQEITDFMLQRIDRWVDIVDIDLAPELFVDAILQDLGNPFSFTLTLTEKRKLGHLLVPIYRSKGLARGIKSAVRLFMGLEVTLRYPYFRGLRLGTARLHGAGPVEGTFILAGSAYDAYSYEVVVPRSLSETERDRVRAIATYMQVAHEHLVRIVEPAAPPAEPNHLVLGLSRLGVNWRLH